MQSVTVVTPVDVRLGDSQDQLLALTDDPTGPVAIQVTVNPGTLEVRSFDAITSETEDRRVTAGVTMPVTVAFQPPLESESFECSCSGQAAGLGSHPTCASACPELNASLADYSNDPRVISAFYAAGHPHLLGSLGGCRSFRASARPSGWGPTTGTGTATAITAGRLSPAAAPTAPAGRRTTAWGRGTPISATATSTRSWRRS